MKILTPALPWLLLAIVLVGILASLHKYFLTEQYEYLVESSCNPINEECYSRDCDVDGCPPNELAFFHTYIIHADLFASCTDNSCSNICREGTQCTFLPCSEQNEYECKGPFLQEE